jgi:molecular chaperone GrpE
MSREQDEQQTEELLEALDEAEAKIDQITGQNNQDDADQDPDQPGAEQIDDDEALIIENLEQQLQEVTAKSEENYDQFLRARAEMENLRRRTDRELTNAHKYAVEKFAKELLAVIDSLQLGIQASESDDPEVVKLREGGELTLKLLVDIMEKFNIKPVGEIGERFDPEYHQAMTTQPSTDTEPDTVVQVMQKGYQIHDRLLRPALVIVSTAG